MIIAAPRRLATAALLLLAAGCGRAGPPPGPPTPAEVARMTADSLLRRDGPPVGLRVAESLDFPPLRFQAPQPERFELDNGVTVFFLRDATLPVVDAFVDVKGGYIYMDREHYAAAAALLPLMRNGGTERLTSDSVDALVDFHALGMSTSTDGGRMTFGVSGLRRQLDLALGLWADLLLHPRFEAEAVERWRRRELESVRRVADFPGSLAVLEFNRLMYGDHPTGWRMTPEDLAPDRVTPERLRVLHRQTVCPENAVIGVAGDATRDEVRDALERALAGWEPCGTELAEPAPPTLAFDPRVYVIHRPIPQSTVVVGQPGGVRLKESWDYFASRVANWIIGASGFTSRLVTRLRTEEGLAYSAASVWGAARDHERIFGAITHTKGESTVEAVRTIVETMDEILADPPPADEVRLAREAIANGFVFGFTTPVQVVARQVSYLVDGLPSDWLDRYLAGIRSVETGDIDALLRRTVEPSRFTVLIVGDTTTFDASALGATTILPAQR